MMKLPALVKRFCDALVEYDAKTEQLYWYHNERAPELCGQWSSYKKHYQLYRKRYVCKEDFAVWDYFLSPENIRHFAEGKEKERNFLIRFANKNKGMAWQEIFMEKMEDSKVLIGSKEFQDIHRSAAIVQAVLPAFDYVCFIDVETNDCVFYYPDANKTILPPNTSENYHKIVNLMNKKYVVPEEAEELRKNMQLEHVQQELQDKEEYILYATAHEADKFSYKKFYFSYADETKKKILLIRTDVSDIMQERKLREHEEHKRIAYLDNMPVACVSGKVLLDENQKPYDFRITYSNQAYAKLMGVEIEDLLKTNFYDIFDYQENRRLQYYYETAYLGIPHVVKWDNKEKQKHLLIHTFQTEVGHFGCVLVDITEEHFLTQELKKSREEMQRVLETTTDLVFQYDPKNREIILTRMQKKELQKVIPEKELLDLLVDKKYLESEYAQIVEDGLHRIRKGEEHLTVNIQAAIVEGERANWYRMTMFDSRTEQASDRKVFGYLQNIDQDMAKQEKLRKEAQTDALTKVMNAGAGKESIQRQLREQEEILGYNVMFLMDIDDFKSINDTYGHLVGDRVLEAFAEILRKTFRSEDVIYRLGGDEFVAFMKNIPEPEKNVKSVIGRLSMYMEQTKAKYPFLSSSIGIYVTDEKCDFEQYYAEADKALYETKRQGKSHYTVRKKTQ